MTGNRRVLWSPRAKQNLREIQRYYARAASPELADGILREIGRATRRIAERPLARRSREELGLRSALVRPCTIFFRLEDGDVQVVRVLHERRDLAAAFQKDPNGNDHTPD